MAQHIKQLLGTLAFLIRVLVRVLATPLLIWLPANAPGKSADDRASTQVCGTQAENPDGILGSWLQIGPALALVGIWEVMQGMEGLFVLCISLSRAPLSLSTCYSNK